MYILYDFYKHCITAIIIHNNNRFYTSVKILRNIKKKRYINDVYEPKFIVTFSIFVDICTNLNKLKQLDC